MNAKRFRYRASVARRLLVVLALLLAALAPVIVAPAAAHDEDGITRPEDAPQAYPTVTPSSMNDEDLNPTVPGESDSIHGIAQRHADRVCQPQPGESHHSTHCA